MTARPENSIALDTFFKIIVNFINIIVYKAANIVRIGVDNQDVAVNTSLKRPGIRRTNPEFSDDLFEL